MGYIIKLRDTLKRLGLDNLSKIMGTETVKLIDDLGFKVTKKMLAEHVVKQKGPDGLLSDKITRDLLIRSLSEEDARQLANKLGCDFESPYKLLTNKKYKRNSFEEQVLYGFFDCSEFLNSRTYDINLVRPLTSIDPVYPLFDHQRNVCRKVVRYLELDKSPRVLLHLPTGAGKTRTAMNVISNILREKGGLDSVVVWLAYSEELCEQAAEEFERAWSALGDREVNVYRNFGHHKRTKLNDINNGILVSSLGLLYNQSMSSQEMFFDLSRRTILIIMDEAHQSIAPTYQHLLRILNIGDRIPLLGLSATPGRSLLDAGVDIQLAEFYSRNIVTIKQDGYSNPIKYLQDNGFLAQIKYIQLRSPSSHLGLSNSDLKKLEASLDIPQDLLVRLGKDQLRNLLIIDRVIKEARNNGKIIVFACTVEHAKMLAYILRLKELNAESITSETPNESRRTIIEDYKHGDIQILTNYNVLTTGFDAPKTNVAVITRPTKSVGLYSQMVGRAMRGPKVGGNNECRILTVVDDIPGCKDFSEAFNFWDDIWEK